MARPLTKDESSALKRQFLELMELNKGQRYMTAKEMKMPYCTFQYWEKHDEEFSKAANAIWEVQKDKKIKELLERESDACLIFFLKTQCKDRGFVERYETTGRDGNAIETKNETAVTGMASEKTAKNIVDAFKDQLLLTKVKNEASQESKSTH